jgi:hypothetical protein
VDESAVERSGLRLTRGADEAPADLLSLRSLISFDFEMVKWSRETGEIQLSLKIVISLISASSTGILEFLLKRP